MLKAAVTTMSPPKMTRVQNTARQLATVRTSAPTTGAIIGASPPMACITDITFASIVPCATSTMTARATAAAMPPPNPCTTRAAINQ